MYLSTATDGGMPLLCFRRDDILYVDNTLYNAVPGLWRAWKLDADGNKKVGTILSSTMTGRGKGGKGLGKGGAKRHR